MFEIAWHSGFAGAGSKGCLGGKGDQEKQSKELRSAVPSHGLGSDGITLPACRAAGPPPTNLTRPTGTFPFPSVEVQSVVED